ncbi:cytochrome P450 [Nemania sp. FL0916]|nr:cytochrome P450 [Nemania sp. FL0916]
MISSTLFAAVEDLSWAQAAQIVVVVTFVWYIISCVTAWHKLRHIPGPFLASFSHLWVARAVFSGRIPYIVNAEQEKYGAVVRVAPDAVAISDPDTISRLVSARSPYTRGEWYASMRIDYRGDNLLSEIGATSHAKRKAIVNTGFSGKFVAIMEAKIDKWVAALVDSIRAKVANGDHIIDINQLIEYFQVDLISELQMGKEWGDLAAETDHYGFMEMSTVFLPALVTMGFLPAARAIYSSTLFMKLLGPKTTDKDGLGAFMGLIEKEINKRFNNKTDEQYESRDIMDQWIKHGLSADRCQYDQALLIPAGSETVVMAIRGTLLLLMSAPVVYQKLKKEIRDGIASGSISDPITNDEAKSLEYNQAVIREGMRLISPILFGFPKRVPDAGDTICGTFLPGGTEVHTNYYGMMRNKEVFGKDAEVFRPERFLDDGADVARMTRTVELVFGGGRYMCLGKPFAQIELNKIFVQLLRNFDFQVGTPEDPWTRWCYPSFNKVSKYQARITEETTMGL